MVIGIGELQREASSVIKRVSTHGGEGFIVSHNEPRAVLLSLERYETLTALEGRPLEEGLKGPSVRDLLSRQRSEILRLASSHGAKNVRIFGSAARGEESPGSDVDFLVEMEKGRSLLDLVGLSQDLETLLGRKVDLLTDGGVSPYLKDQIYAEARPL